MGKLKLGPIEDERPVKLAIELPAALHRDLVAYATLLAKESGHAAEPAKLVAPMLAKFMASDRAFAKSQRMRIGKDDTSAPNDARNTHAREGRARPSDGARQEQSQSSEAGDLTRPRLSSTSS